MHEERDRITAAIVAMEQLIAGYKEAEVERGLNRGASSTPGAAPSAPPKGPRYGRPPEVACERCGAMKPEGAGMAAHIRWHDRNSPPTQAEVRAQDEFQCRFCSVTCGSYASWREHEEKFCDKRLTEHTSVAHAHVWKLGSPQGLVVKGKCLGCGANREFSSDPDHTNSFRVAPSRG